MPQYHLVERRSIGGALTRAPRLVKVRVTFRARTRATARGMARARARARVRVSALDSGLELFDGRESAVPLHLVRVRAGVRLRLRLRVRVLARGPRRRAAPLP